MLTLIYVKLMEDALESGVYHGIATLIKIMIRATFILPRKKRSRH